jgi:hypothetical protein
MKAPLCAIRLGANGDITPPPDGTSTETIAWYKNRDGTYVQTPLVGGKLYFASEVGDVYVVQTGPRFELLAKNSMGDVCMATPAISGQLLIVRTKNAVYAIEE